ncbi:MAG TPA: helix-turn-helix transcriptional regulator [Pyrinomonadaceae bacterium]|jgi:transcriptional regulator with XRE-family HTH domain
MAKENNLKAARVREGLNKTELASVSGVSTRTITRVEEAKRSVSPTTYFKILNGLNKRRSREAEYTPEEVFGEKIDFE